MISLIERIEKRNRLRLELEKTMAKLSEVIMGLQDIGAQDYIEAEDSGTATTLTFVKVEQFGSLH